VGDSALKNFLQSADFFSFCRLVKRKKAGDKKSRPLSFFVLGLDQTFNKRENQRRFFLFLKIDETLIFSVFVRQDWRFERVK
jgi:hypothetical protein